MLKGHVFNLQTFTSDAFALFFDKFLNQKCGVATGCALSNTNNTVTIAEGYFIVKGRILQIISGEIVSGINTNGFYRLICEVDLSKVNTTDTLNQATIKVIYNASDYPVLTQEDITEGAGTVYQFEFARFKVEGGVISNFTDARTYVDYGEILSLVQDELDDLESQSNVSLKTDFALLTGTIPGSSLDDGYQHIDVNYPAGFSISNCVVISTMVNANGASEYSEYEGRASTTLQASKVSIGFDRAWGADMNYKVVLMKIS